MIHFLSFLLIINILKTFIIEHINSVTDNEAVNEKMNSALSVVVENGSCYIIIDSI